MNWGVRNNKLPRDSKRNKIAEISFCEIQFTKHTECDLILTSSLKCLRNNKFASRVTTTSCLTGTDGNHWLLLWWKPSRRCNVLFSHGPRTALIFTLSTLIGSKFLTICKFIRCLRFWLRRVHYLGDYLLREKHVSWPSITPSVNGPGKMEQKISFLFLQGIDKGLGVNVLRVLISSTTIIRHFSQQCWEYDKQTWSCSPH